MSTFEHRSVTDTVKAFYMKHPWIYSTAIVVIVFLILWASSLDSAPNGAITTINPADEQGRVFQFVVDTLDEAENDRVEVVAASTVERLNQWMEKLSDKEPWRPDPLITEWIEKSLPPQARALGELDDLDVLEFTSSDGYAVLEAQWLAQIAHAVGQTPPPELAEGNPAELARIVQLFDWTVRNIAIEPDEGSVPHMPWQILLQGRGRLIDRAWLFSLLCRQAGVEVVMLGRVQNIPGAALAGQQNTQTLETWIPAALVENKLYLFDHEYGVPIYKSDGVVATLGDVKKDDSPLRALDIPSRPYPVSSSDLDNVAVLIEASPQFLKRRMFILENYLAEKGLSFGSSGTAKERIGSGPRRSGGNSITLSEKPVSIATRLQQNPNVKAFLPWSLPVERRAELAQTFSPRQPDESIDAFQKRNQIVAQASKEMMPFFLPAVHITQSAEAMVDLETMIMMNFDDDSGMTLEERQKQAAAKSTKTEQLWDVLLRGRLRYFEGQLGGDRSASWFYQKARPSDEDFVQMQRDTEEQIKKLAAVVENPAETDLNRQRADQQRYLLENMVPGKRVSRELATLWLGLLHYQKQSYREAVVYFGERFIDREEYKDSALNPLAVYNLGRSLEMLAAETEDFPEPRRGETDEQRTEREAREQQLRQEAQQMRERALALYDGESATLYIPQARARAHWLRQQLQLAETD